MNSTNKLESHLKIELQSLKRSILNFVFIVFAIIFILLRMVWRGLFGDKFLERPEIDDPIVEGDIMSNHFRIR